MPRIADRAPRGASSRLNCDAGTAAVEACIAGAFAIPAIAGLIAVCYFVFARAWVQHWAYEGAMCIARGESEPACGRRLRLALEAGLPIGQVRVARAWREGLGAFAEAHFQASGCEPSSICLRARAIRRVALPLAATPFKEPR